MKEDVFKKISLGFFVLVLMASLVLAIDNNNQQSSNTQSSVQTATQTPQQNTGQDSQIQNQIQNRISTGNYSLETGKKVRIQERTNNRIELKAGNVSADTSLELLQEKIQNKTRLKVKLSNGKYSEIKVMPDTASERALERLRLKVCSEENNCSIELKETGLGNETKVAYQVKAQKQFKILSLFRKRAEVQAEVNAENGEIIRTKKPWWAFLASENEE